MSAEGPASAPLTPSPSQRLAIEASAGPLLVLAGPGAGKTFCLIERIGFLIDRHEVDPARICAFTFTNKAADEIAHRLVSRLGAKADAIRRGTIHAFCADLLREFGSAVGVDTGFGIADEEYQRGVLRRIEGPRRWHGQVLKRFSAFRFRGEELQRNDRALFEAYEQFLEGRRILDFDTLVLRASELLNQDGIARQVRARSDVVLVDEFQDLNPVQYRVIRALALEHRHVFAVGDDEQSIFSWAGADPQVFREYVNDFSIAPEQIISLEENRRCPREVFALARKLLTANTPMFSGRIASTASRESEHAVRALRFLNNDDEAAWLVDDLKADHAASEHRWGDVGILYRTHDIGYHLESTLLNAGIPCRLARGHALADDPVVGYVLAALRVVASPDDDIVRNELFRALLPRALYDEALAKAEERSVELRRQLTRTAAHLPHHDENGRQIRRALANWRNLDAIGKQHTALGSLIRDLLSRRVGRVTSALDEMNDDLSDPAADPDVVALAELLRDARARRAFVHLPALGGAEIGVQGFLADIGVKAVRGREPAPGEPVIRADATVGQGFAVGAFKAAQLMEMEPATDEFTNFTSIDIETTDKDTRSAEVVEIAAVRVRDGKVVAEWSSLVKAVQPIAPAATEAHGISDADVATAPAFDAVWPIFREFCGTDVVVAHNGYSFDFPILHRQAREFGEAWDITMFDTLPLARHLVTTSRTLVNLAARFDVPLVRAHRALDDSRALALVFLKLGEEQRKRSRKTALVDLLGHLGVALALSDEAKLSDEALRLKDRARIFALGRYGGALEWFDAERGPDDPTREVLITRLGGETLMAKVRATKTADERYPVAMMRLRRLMAGIPDGTLHGQLALFLERAALSRQDGTQPEVECVNLLTLHSTKGLEFSRVYVVGAEDARLPGGSPTKGPTPREVEEARRLLYVGMTRTKDRLVLTNVTTRSGKPTGGHKFLDEMALRPESIG